jgi:hypothetical protein
MKTFNKPSDGHWASNPISYFVKQKQKSQYKAGIGSSKYWIRARKIFINTLRAPKTYPYQRLPVVYPAMVNYQS